MSEMRWREAVVRVLRESDGPVHYADIAQIVIDNGYRRNVGATPAATVAAQLSGLRTRGIVERVRSGTYRLASTDTERSRASRGIELGSSADDAEPDEADVEEEMGLINAFGMFWRRSEVDWSSRFPRLLGVQQSGSERVDFGSQAGVYLLYDGNRVVYVGRVSEPRLAQRLREHTRDRLTGRWNRFSWFGVRRVEPSGELSSTPDAGIGVATLIATMEALLIEGLEPPQNRRQGDGFSALEFIQVSDPEVERQRKQAFLAEMMGGLRQ